MAKENAPATTDGTGDEGTPASGATAQDDGRTYIVVPMPKFMRVRFEQEAKAADVPLGPYVRNLIAKQLGIELPAIASSRRRKYATPEEAAQAQKAARIERNDLVKKLLAEHKARMAGANGTATAATAEAPAEEAVPA